MWQHQEKRCCFVTLTLAHIHCLRQVLNSCSTSCSHYKRYKVLKCLQVEVIYTGCKFNLVHALNCTYLAPLTPGCLAGCSSDATILTTPWRSAIPTLRTESEYTRTKTEYAFISWTFQDAGRSVTVLTHFAVWKLADGTSLKEVRPSESTAVWWSCSTFTRGKPKSPPLVFDLPGCLASWRGSREARPTTSATSSPSWTPTSLPTPSSTSSRRWSARRSDERWRLAAASVLFGFFYFWQFNDRLPPLPFFDLFVNECKRMKEAEHVRCISALLQKHARAFLRGRTPDWIRGSAGWGRGYVWQRDGRSFIWSPRRVTQGWDEEMALSGLMVRFLSFFF